MKITGCRLSVSIPEGLDNSVTRFQQGKAGKRLVGNSAYCFEDEKSLIKRLKKVDRVRYAASGRVPAEVFKAAAETGFYIARAAVAMEGSVELLQYYLQQSICNNYHRYGNLGDRVVDYQID